MFYFNCYYGTLLKYITNHICYFIFVFPALAYYELIVYGKGVLNVYISVQLDIHYGMETKAHDMCMHLLFLKCTMLHTYKVL
jgi:hypothetical protein